MGYDKMNDQLTIVRKTGECVVVSHPGMDDAVMTHFLQSETQSGESMLLGGQPVAACFMPSTRHMRYCLYAPSASTGNLSSGPPAVPKAIAPTSLVSVVAGSTMDGESDIDLEATPLAAVKASKGTFPHALPGRSILDALYVPSTASLRRYQDDSSAGDTKIATSAACLEVVRPRMPSPAPPAPTSGVLESLLSIAASPREEGPRACRDMDTMAPADVTRGVFNLSMH